MALINIENYYAVGVPTKAHAVENWCEEHIGPYQSGWQWVAAFGNSLILRITNDHDAVLFKLTFSDECLS